jgi:TM2 domain-containing membrane protein YozV
MHCLHVNIRRATFIILSIIVNNISIIQMIDNKAETKPASQNKNNSDNDEQPPPPIDSILHCPSNLDCKDLHPQCMTCNMTPSCKYGEVQNATCNVNSKVECRGRKIFEKSWMCRYCYQTEPWEHTCDLKASCNSVASPRINYTTNCTVKSDILCLGNRTFKKNVLCNWTGGYRWTTALILSITLGGFGADRFYLGHWQEGIGKLFSFGGLGVWTIIDVILISLHYLGPADGSLYI